MISFITYAILRSLLVTVIGVTPMAPAASRAAAVTTPVTVALPATPAATAASPAAVAVTACEVALAYLHLHANPIFSMRCEPGGLPGGLAAVTCWRSTGLGVSCPDGGIIVISQPSCRISYENEASNSWLDFATLTAGAINGHSRHDASGRAVDPFGEC